VGVAGVTRTNEQRGRYHEWVKERRVDGRPRCGLVKGRARAVFPPGAVWVYR